MPHAHPPVLRFLTLLGLYLAGAVLASRAVVPGEVALFWPSAGLAFAALIRYGLRWVWFIVVAIPLLHWQFDPVPAGFVPFSIASNSLGAMLGAALVRRRPEPEWVSVRGGMRMVAAALAMAAVSGAIGVTGMWLNGMTEADRFAVDLSRWTLGDLLSIIAIAPLVLLLTADPKARAQLQPGHEEHVFRAERETWALLLLATLAAILIYADPRSPFALGFTAVPLGLLLWSAIRFPMLWTAAGVALAVFALTIATAYGFAGFASPSRTGEVIVLLAFLSMVALIPMLLAAATHERRVVHLRALRRATTDALTGLPNRAAFESAMRQALESARARPCVLAYIDLDHLTLVNDTASHAAGDALIAGIASLLRARLPVDEPLFRIGGDEFAVMICDSDPETVHARMLGLLEDIGGYRLGWEGSALGTSASIGLAAFTTGSTRVANVLASADAACFTAKELGGNRICIASDEAGAMHERTEAMRWAMRIRDSLERGQFELHCQAIAPLAAEPPRGLHFEVLLRLRNPAGGLCLPGSFIPAVERFRLGVPLDRHVVDLVLDWLDAHPAEADRISTCAINLTAAALVNDDFIDYLRQRLEHGRLPPARLCLEITETSAVRDLAHARRMIARLREIGCRFALDDFGTGFCSFSYLQALEVDYLKIDGSFVRNLETSPLAASIIRSITDIAHVLDKKTVAEHVEHEAVQGRLRMLQVDYAQGFAIHRPEPIEDYFAAALAMPGAHASAG